MRILNKLVYACCSIAFGLMALPSCEGGELYDVNAPRLDFRESGLHSKFKERSGRRSAGGHAGRCLLLR